MFLLVCYVLSQQSNPTQFSEVHLALCVENVHLMLVSCKRHLLDFTHDVNMATTDSYMRVCVHACVRANRFGGTKKLILSRRVCILVAMLGI